MEISHASTETQSAAVGIDGKAEEVTVSTDAEFMMMIAHGIYSNKALALVRELICNARDGHAKAGCMDKPIIVTLTENLLVVRDHGTGIPNAIFARTYMTFGKSTKRQDKLATGGFGVGTKVPWAVCDVFSARNYIEGSMTAYSIVKSDPKLEGKPSCTPVMSIPSKEPSGVEVSVPFPEKMHREINAFVQLFAAELDIPILLNGTLYKPSGDFAGEELKKFRFKRIPRHPKTVIQTSNFYVRQGDVLYPIECQDEFKDAWEMLDNLNAGHGEPIVFMADPDSIIPTLSRESLQYTDRTTHSIRELMKKALQVLADNVDKYAGIAAEVMPNVLPNMNSFMPEMWGHCFDIPRQMSGLHREHLHLKELSATQNYMLLMNTTRWMKGQTPYLETKKTVGKVFRETINNQLKSIFIKKLAKFWYLDHENLVRLWKRRENSYQSDLVLDKEVQRNAYEEAMFWREEARSNPEITEAYFPKSEDLHNAVHSRTSASYVIDVSSLNLDDKKEKTFAHHYDHLKWGLWLSKTVVISTLPNQMLKRASEHLPPDQRSHVLQRSLGRLFGARCVRIKASTKQSDIDAMKLKYEGWGYSVITFMEPTKEEIAEKEAAALERAKVKEVPLPYLHELIRGTIPRYPPEDYRRNRRHLKALIANPDFKGQPLYIILPRGKELPFGLKDFDSFKKVVKFVGTDIICVSTKPEIARIIKEGRKSLDDALLEFARWFFTQPGMHAKLMYRGTFFEKRARQNQYLTKYLFNRIPPAMTEQEDLIYRSLWDLSGPFDELRRYLNMKAKLYSDCGVAKHYERVFAEYAQNNFCDVHRALEKAYAKVPSRKRALARSILKTILKERPA